jgi:uncharacterized membrane protein
VPFDRPDSWNFPLLLHVAGAMLLVGSLLLVASILISAWRSGSVELVRSAARLLIVAVFPSYLLMRLGAQWIASKEGLDNLDNPPSWIDIGFTVADFGLLLLIISMIATGLAVRRLKRDGSAATISARIATGLVSLLLVAYLVAVWAMTTKPA